MIGFRGPITYYDYDIVAFFAGLIVATLSLPILILPVLHYLRYSLVVKNESVGNMKSTFLFCCSITVSLILGISWYDTWINSGKLRNNGNFNYATLWYHEQDLPVIVVGDTLQFRIVILGIMSVVTVITSYVIALVLCSKTLCTLKRVIVDGRIKRAREQLGKALLFQVEYYFC